MNDTGDKVNSLGEDEGLDEMLDQLSTTISTTVAGFIADHVKEGTLEEDYFLRCNKLTLVDKEYVKQEQLTLTYARGVVATGRLLVYLVDTDESLDIVVELQVPEKGANQN
ncbi:MAG: hypothetical protein L3J47_00130 [Sulfurovum sp.]|nr:hypothetical protein [Sulfurovum sp.]